MAGAMGGSSVVVDNYNVTDRELKESINQAITEGKIPQIDLTKVSLERVSQTYFDIATEYGVDLNPTKNKVDLYEKIYELVREITPVDCDSDPVLEVNVINRKKFERSIFLSIPYRNADPEAHFQALITNLSIISERISIEMRLREMNKEKAQ